MEKLLSGSCLLPLSHYLFICLCIYGVQTLVNKLDDTLDRSYAWNLARFDSFSCDQPRPAIILVYTKRRDAWVNERRSLCCKLQKPLSF